MFVPYEEMMARIASEYTRKYKMVEHKDLMQEQYLWFVSHPRKFKEWTALGEKDCVKLLAKSLRNACLKYCEKEKARAGGYDVSDVYYYEPVVVEAYLPTIIAESYEMPAKLKSYSMIHSKGEISDGMNWLAIRSDIAAAFYKLNADKQHILRVRFSDESRDWESVAEELGTTKDGARMKVQRAVIALIRNLGGERPFHDKDQKEKQHTSTDEAPDEQG